MSLTPLKIEIPNGGEVSAIWQSPAEPAACLALAHGAGAGMTHRSMVAIADGLEGLGVATLRCQLPYMEKGSKRPDSPAVAQAAVRASVAEAGARAQGSPLSAGGRSFGAPITSQAHALKPLAGVRGLIFFAFPLHPSGKPSVSRATHLGDIEIPLFFLQGSNDALAQLDLLQQTVAGMGARATLDLVADADHAFHVPARTGRKDDQVLAATLATAVRWMAAVGLAR